MKRARHYQTLNSFLAEETARDPEFGRQFEGSKARILKSRLNRPPSGVSGDRQMRFRADARLAERIRRAAQRESRSVSSWLERAARRALQAP